MGQLKAFAHRHVWQRIPASARRAALLRFATTFAPKPSTEPTPNGPVIVAGVLTSPTGLGVSARLCYRALEATGFDVYGIDLSEPLMQPKVVDFSFRDGSDLTGAGIIILHVNSPLTPLALLMLGQRRVRDKTVIGYWHWELPKVPAEWKAGVGFVNEIWVPSGFCAEAIAPVAGPCPIRIVPHPVAPSAVQIDMAERRSRGAAFTVLSMFDMGSSFARKNPLASIAAFRQAFGNDPTTRLIVKTHNTSAFDAGRQALETAVAGASNIEVISKSLQPDALAALYAEADVLISLHRAEGFGLPLAEAMLAGIPVVATNWSGNADFLAPDRSFPIDFKLVAAQDAQRTYHYPDVRWADADVGQAVNALRALRDDRNLRNRMGEAARAYALENWSAERYANVVRASLILPD